MKLLSTILVALTLAACTSGPPIDNRYTSQNQDSRVQFLILHFTNGDFQHSLEELTMGNVSSHYLVDVSPPTIYQLVPESRRAWHAGQSYWNGVAQLNAGSIGIEIVNRGEQPDPLKPGGKIYADYPQAQIDAVIALVKKIVAEHHIRPEYILGHSDIAPQRKVDPGPKFPWKQLADAGLIPWPDAARVAQRQAAFAAALPSASWFQQKLARHGYQVPQSGEFDETTCNVISAFQMKYRPARFDGMADAETAAILDVLTAQTIDALSLDKELAAIVADPGHPLASLSVLAIRQGEVVHQNQFGNRRIDDAAPQNNLPANAQTMYRVASISKLVTTLGVMKLVEDGKLNLDADVSDYLGYRLRNPHFPDAPITLRMLLSHTASLRDDAGYFWDETVALKDVLLPTGSKFGKGAMWAANAAPGQYFTYCNLGWGLIGTLMEGVSGERFDRLMQRLILQPMDIRGGFNPAAFDAGELSNLATLYRKRSIIDAKEIWNPSGPWIAQVDDYRQQPPVARAGPGYVPGNNGTLFGPQGNLRISAADLGKIMLMLMNEGRFEGKTILKKSSLDKMLARQWRFDRSLANGSGNGDTENGLYRAWGLGNQHFIDVSDGKAVGSGDRPVAAGGWRAFGHLGDAWGLTAAFVFDPTAKNGMIFLGGGPGIDPETRRGKYSSMNRSDERILDALYRRAILGVMGDGDGRK